MQEKGGWGGWGVDECILDGTHQANRYISKNLKWQFLDLIKRDSSIKIENFEGSSVDTAVSLCCFISAFISLDGCVLSQYMQGLVGWSYVWFKVQCVYDHNQRVYWCFICFY